MVIIKQLQKAQQIFSRVPAIRKITKNYYIVDSISSNKSYTVRRLDADVWICECKDFLYRLTRSANKNCKHILACKILFDSTVEEDKIEKIERPHICPKCFSSLITKNGFRIIKNGIRRQKYRCKQCYYKFTLGENGFSKVSSDPKIITESLNLYLSGMSLRNIARHIKITHNRKITHASIYNWFRKYLTIIKEYVDSITPQSSNVWSLDEMMVNVKKTKPISGKGFYDWLWTIVDPQTRFVIATEVSKRREVLDARKIIAKGKKIAKPSYVITDSLRTYERAIRKELDARKTAHIRTKSLEEGFENRPIERYHNEVRSVIKSKRGLGNDESAQKFSDYYRTFHNFVRPHTGLEDNITPAEASGIDLKLGNDKIKDLITKSVESKGNFAIQLGKRIDRVTIANEGDCIKVIPKGWIEKQTWREINDILRLNGFGWLSNGKDSCWMKFQS
jgi:transposase-like protein/predicted nucleic acid-binding Zn finger protein